MAERIVRLVKVKPKARDQQYQNIADDVRFDSTSVTVAEGGSANKLKVDAVYDGALTTGETIAAHQLQPIIQEMLNGINGIFLTLGAEKSGKSHMMNGKNGIWGCAIRGVFQALEDKSRTIQIGNKKNQSGSQSNIVRLSFFEICEEHVRDLLIEDTKAAPVIAFTDTLDYGVVLENCTASRLESMNHGFRVLEEGFGRRYSNAPNIARKISTVLKIELVQEGKVYSNLYIIEAASLNCLANDRNDVQLKFGFDSFRGIYAFSDLVMNHNPDVIGSVQQSKLTWILRDIFFGQNVIVAVCLCLQQREPDVSKKGLELLDALSDIRLAPVRWDQKTSMLQRAMRREILQLRRNAGKEGSGGDPNANNVGGGGSGFQSALAEEQKKRIQSLEGEVLTEQKKLAQVTEDKRKLQLNITKKQKRHDLVLLSVMALKKEKLEKDADRLRTCRALVALQKKYNKLHREMEDSKYVNTNKIVNFEQEVIDLSLENEKKGEKLTNLERQTQDLQEMRDDLEEQLQAAKKAVNVLKMEKGKQDGTNEELSVELVNLMNAKNESEKRCAQINIKYVELKNQYDKFQTEHVMNEENLQAFRERVGSLKTQLDAEMVKSGDLRHELDALKIENTDLKKKVLDFENDSLDSRGNAAKLAKELQEEQQIRIARDLEIERLKQEFEHVKTGMEKGFLALTKQLNPADVFKQAGEATEWEVQRLKDTIRDLEGKLAAGGGGGMSPAAQARREELLHQEIKRLREELKAGGKLRDSEIDKQLAEKTKECERLRQENRELHDANLSLKSQLEGNTELLDRIKDLENKNRELQLQVQRPNNMGGDDNTLFLQQQCRFLENTIIDMEKERAKLLIRATSAEEQLKETQAQMTDLLSGKR